MVNCDGQVAPRRTPDRAPFGVAVGTAGRS